jgi:hypothetical protein
MQGARLTGALGRWGVVRVAGFVAATAVLASYAPARACELVLTEHRSGQPLQRLALPAGVLRIAFEHSVLGTTVVDRYQFEASGAGGMGDEGMQAVLTEERFEGQGYGLPHTAGPGERLVREGDGWRLTLRRVVHPLVVRPLPAQRMRLLLDGLELPLAGWSQQAIELRADGCTAASLAPLATRSISTNKPDPT